MASSETATSPDPFTTLQRQPTVHTKSTRAKHDDVEEPDPVDTEETVDTPNFVDTTSRLEISVDPGQVSFVPQGELSYNPYNRVDITLASPTGKQIVKSFAPGEPLVLAGNLPDGGYTWEATTTVEVSPYIREEMRKVRESGDLEAEKELISRLRAEGYLPTERQAQANRQSGHFRIVNGSIPSADETE